MSQMRAHIWTFVCIPLWVYYSFKITDMVGMVPKRYLYCQLVISLSLVEMHAYCFEISAQLDQFEDLSKGTTVTWMCIITNVRIFSNVAWSVVWTHPSCIIFVIFHHVIMHVSSLTLNMNMLISVHSKCHY